MKHSRRQPVAETPASPDTPSFVRPALIIFAAALLLRLLHVWQIRRAPFFTMLMGDAHGYDAWAERIAGGEWIGRDVFYQAPLYPYFLGVIYAIAGHSLLVVRIVQALVGSASCALLGATASRLFSRSAGLVAGLALAIYAPAIFFDGVMQKSVLDVFFVSLAIWLMSRLITPVASSVVSGSRSTSAASRLPRTSFASRHHGTWLVLGLAMGGLALTRENAMVLVTVIVVWALVGPATVRLEPDTTRGAKPITTGGVRAAAVFLAGLALVLVPVAARNYAVGGGFYITTSQFGSNFYIGNNPRSDGTYMSLRYGRGSPEYERQDATELAEHALGRTLAPAEVSSYWTGRATAFITSQPGAWLTLLGRKFVLLWNADEMLDTESQETYAEWSLPLGAGSWFGHFGVLVPLAVFGAFVAWPDRRRLWVFYVMVAVYSASVIMFYVFARYRFPLVPMLVLFAAAGLVEALELVKGNRQLFFTGLPISPLSFTAVLAAAVFTNWPLLSPTLMRAITENNLATAFQEDGRLDEAINHYKRSIELRTDYAPAYNNLAVALRARGQLDEAVASYERALAIQPDYPDAHYNLANALLDQQKADEAAGHFRVALQSIPDLAPAHNNLGIALAAEGKLEEAAEQFRAAIRLEPGSAKSHKNLGNALSSMGRRDEAIGFLKRAVELDPKDPDAHYDLGGEWLEMDQLQAAIAEFQAALTLAPDMVAAHNNLGIALASQGRVDEAIAHFQQALTLDPAFADAKRNLEIARTQKKGAGR